MGELQSRVDVSGGRGLPGQGAVEAPDTQRQLVPTGQVETRRRRSGGRDVAVRCRHRLCLSHLCRRQVPVHVVVTPTAALRGPVPTEFHRVMILPADQREVMEYRRRSSGHHGGGRRNPRRHDLRRGACCAVQPRPVTLADVDAFGELDVSRLPELLPRLPLRHPRDVDQRPPDPCHAATLTRAGRPRSLPLGSHVDKGLTYSATWGNARAPKNPRGNTGRIRGGTTEKTPGAVAPGVCSRSTYRRVRWPSGRWPAPRWWGRRRP